MTKYAENTSVDSGKSRAEIERTLTRYGADGFMYGWQDNAAMIAFRLQGRHVKFSLPLPSIDAPEIVQTPTGKIRSMEKRHAEVERAVRQRWRALALVVKAKLEAVESGVTEFEDEFMAHIQLPGGRTVSEFMRPQIEVAYNNGTMPALLPGPKN